MSASPDWPALYRWRDRYARYWWLRHGGRIPIEEYLSAGNLGLAEAYGALEHPAWERYARQCMTRRMSEVWREEHGMQAGQQVTRYWARPLWRRLRRPHRGVSPTSGVFAWLPPDMRRLLGWLAGGMTPAQIGRRLRVTKSRVSQLVKELRTRTR